MIASIDIGLDGASAMIWPDRVDFVDKLQPMLDHFWRMGHYSHQCEYILIEKPITMGGGAKSMKTTFRNYGRLLELCKRTGAPVIEIEPCDWTGYIRGILGKSNGDKLEKQETADLVMDKFPQPELYNKKGALIDGRSDALGIALYYLKTQL